MRIERGYFIVFLMLFVIELIIAKFIKQPFIRYWLGDLLIVLMIYYFIKSIIKAKPIQIAIGVLTFAYAVEFLQRSQLLDLLNLRNNKVANLILGTTFSWSDMLAYTIGFLIIMWIEFLDKQKKQHDIHVAFLFFF